MKIQLTADGLLIPTRFLQGVREVEIRQEQDRILIVPLHEDDPILALGQSPIVEDVDDASECHDRHLYKL